jgi:1,2-diacylglycerol 3-beta-glucosyltransferase
LEDPRTRQWQTALVWACVLLAVAGVHLAPQGLLVAGLLAVGAGLYAGRLVFALPPFLESNPDYQPRVSVLVAARNEESVIARLVDNLCALDYPDYEVWVADDGSTDATYRRLVEAGLTRPRLNILKRPAGSRPGKSAVLNDLLARAKGDILVVFDADAQVQQDFLRRTVPYFADPNLGALQVRKAIVNAEENFWTRGQAAEMLLDAWQQQQRSAVGGTAELRGNGQLVRTKALKAVRGWTESTVTDDLDLTFKLHLAGWGVQFVADPFVYEEGVTTWQALWRQRSRWAEGGFQRYLDYAAPFTALKMGSLKTLDQVVFGAIQYLLPVAGLFDLVAARLSGSLPLLAPVLTVASLFTLTGLFLGQRQANISLGQAALGTVLGFVYFLHWFPVIVVKLGRMVLQPKRLVWIKTTHQGS